MRYNYLHLDRKLANFQQIKNLLAYDQLVSITFDAHERILECRKYLDEKVKNFFVFVGHPLMA
jgi:histidine ammonia-lyase